MKRFSLGLLLTALLLGLALFHPASAVAELVRPEYLRTKTEWVALRGGGGSGAASSLSLVTLRWEWFYWGLLRGGVAGLGVEDFSGLAWGGTVVGVPLHAGDTGRHEFRVGAGIGGGYLDLDADSELFGLERAGDWKGACIVAAPEIYYVWHFETHFAFLFGAELVIAFEFDQSPSMLSVFMGAAF